MIALSGAVPLFVNLRNLRRAMGCGLSSVELHQSRRYNEVKSSPPAAKRQPTGSAGSGSIACPPPRPLKIDGQIYTRVLDRFWMCTVSQASESGDPVCIRGRIYCSGEFLQVRHLSEVPLIRSVCLPSSIESIYPPGPHHYPSSKMRVMAFEWRSEMCCIDVGTLMYTRLRSLFIPASVTRVAGDVADFPRSLEVVTFESVPLDESARSPPSPNSDLAGHPVYLLGAGNLHFAVAGESLMNLARTSLLRYCGTPPPDLTIDSTVEELAPGCFHRVSILTVGFAQPSRVRLIGAGAFHDCRRLRLFDIPATVEVIGASAFSRCGALQEVRIERGSRLQTIERNAFDDCDYLQPVDVPAAATIETTFEILATVFDEDGVKRIRARFITRVMAP
jgi:hypothetical protein